MRIVRFPSCCGIKIIADIYEIAFFRSRKKKIKNVEKRIKENIYKIIKQNNSHIEPVSLVMITLSTNQNRDYGKIIKDFGFKLKQKFIGNHQSLVYIYTLEVRGYKK